MRHKRTAAQLRKEAVLVQKEGEALMKASMEGMTGREGLARARQIQKCFARARQLRALAETRS